MCTIALAFRVVPGYPIAFAANREERYDRPAEPPADLESDPAVFGPRDLVAGGTWLGINEHGLVVAITNRAGGTPGPRSRGWLVRDALTCRSAAEAADSIATELERREYDGFNLLFVDPAEAIVFVWDGTLRRRNLPAGIHSIVNEGIDKETAKSTTIRARLQTSAPASIAEWVDLAKPVLRDHGIGACLHGEEGGTRSSSIIAMRDDGHVTYEFATGHPCQSEYQRYADGPF